MKNVLIDCERTKYPNTGLYHFCLSLGNALIKQTDTLQEQLFFYVPPSRKNLFGTNQQYVIQHPLHKIFQPRTNRFQVWHSTHQDAVYRPFSNKIKTLLTVHDLNFLIERKGEPNKIKKRLQQVQENINRADAIISISAFTRQTILDHLDVKGKLVEVIYNGCNINEFPGFDKPAYQPSKPFIFTVGTVLPKKNFHTLPCLLRNNDYELVIAGIINKTYEAKILEEAQLHGVADRVVLAGEISEENKYWYYKNCMAFAFPSLAEGFGFPLAEAMYYGKPCFVSRLTSLPEIGGDVVYYFDSFEPAAMQQVFEHGLQHYNENNPAATIHERAMKFSWAEAAKSYLSLYRSL